MTDGIRGYNRSGIGAAAALLSLAAAIIVCFALNNWWLLIPILLLEMGIFVLVLGVSLGGSGMTWRRADSNYYLFWGNLLAVLGALLIAYILLPGNGLFLFVIFLIWMAVFALLFSMRRKG